MTQAPPRLPRSRPVCVAVLAITVALGLASRRFADVLPDFLAEYAGDTLWAAMVFWIAAIVFPRASTARLAAAAFGLAVVVELSQLYHAPWIDAIRDTRLGALVLGYGFLWSDLVCYAAGAGLAALIDVGPAMNRASPGAQT